MQGGGALYTQQLNHGFVALTSCPKILLPDVASARVFRPLIDDQNGWRFIYCLSGNQIILCCRSLDGSALINSLLLQTQGAGRGLLIKERTSETVNKRA